MKTVEEIYNEMLEVFRRETGAEAAEVSDLSVKLYAVAAQVYGLYVQADWLARQVFPQTAAGEFLDRHAALRGLERRPAARAEGVVRFLLDVPKAADVAVPAGTVCATAGLTRFETTRAGAIPAGEDFVDLPARAVEPGSGGNVPAGAVRAMAVPPVGVSRCINPAPFAGGMDTEGDETLRARVLETYRRMPNGANAAFYEQGALSFEQVAAAAVLPRQRGRGTVDVVVATQGGMPGEALLAELRDYFEARREIAVDVEVRAPEEKSVDVRVKIKTAEGTDAETVRAGVEAAVRGWFSGGRLGKDVLAAELNQLVFSQPGVVNCAILAPAADVTVARAELPRLGTLTVEAAV